MSKKVKKVDGTKMVRIGNDEHLLLKKMAVWKGKTMQEYFEELVKREFKKVFPS
jgi:hypothetical protein